MKKGCEITLVAQFPKGFPKTFPPNELRRAVPSVALCPCARAAVRSKSSEHSCPAQRVFLLQRQEKRGWVSYSQQFYCKYSPPEHCWKTKPAVTFIQVVTPTTAWGWDPSFLRFVKCNFKNLPNRARSFGAALNAVISGFLSAANSLSQGQQGSTGVIS